MNKWRLFSSMFQIVVGVAAIIAYIVIAASGEPLGQVRRHLDSKNYYRINPAFDIEKK